VAAICVGDWGTSAEGAEGVGCEKGVPSLLEEGSREGAVPLPRPPQKKKFDF